MKIDRKQLVNSSEYAGVRIAAMLYHKQYLTGVEYCHAEGLIIQELKDIETVKNLKE